MIGWPFEMDESGHMPEPTREEYIQSAIRQSILTPINSHPYFPEVGSNNGRIFYMNRIVELDPLAIEWTKACLSKDVPEIEVTLIEPQIPEGSDFEDYHIIVGYVDLETAQDGTVDVTINKDLL
jgi:hypothetical protein